MVTSRGEKAHHGGIAQRDRTAGRGGHSALPPVPSASAAPGPQLTAGSRAQPVSLSQEGAGLPAEPGLEPHFSPPLHCINALCLREMLMFFYMPGLKL